MKYALRFLLVLLSLSVRLPASAQINWPSPEVEQMYNDAKAQLSQGNLQQAIMLYSRAVRIAPDIMVIHRDLANAYYLAGYYEEARNTLNPIIESGSADEQSFQIMAASYLEEKEDRKARNYIKKGLERYPHSGLLYNQLGKMYLELKKDEDALKTFLEGIEEDPIFHLNYYDAARTYMRTEKTVWAIIYAEIFINLEQQTARANETRGMLVAAYKRLYNSFAIGEMPKYDSRAKTPKPTGFEGAVYDTYLKLSPVVSDGISTENLIMLRTRFMMEWQANYAQRYPFTLFRRHDGMLRDGYFDTYNQWLFGKAISPQEYQAWNTFHAKEMPELERFMRGYPYSPVAADNYNKKEVKGIFMKEKND